MIRLARPLAGGAMLGALGLASAAGALAAAEPARLTPERLTTVTGLESLPGEISGVLGSGNQLRLALRVGGQPRTLNIGDEYRDGWVLLSLTNAMATLGKSGQVRLIGLNPYGAASAPPGPTGVSQLSMLAPDPQGDDADDNAAAERSERGVLGLLTVDQKAVLQREIDSGRWDGRPAWNLSQDQTNRLIAYDDQRDRAYADWYAQNWVAGVTAMEISTRPTEQEVLGSDWDDYNRLAAIRTQYRNSQFANEMAMPLAGPSSFYLPAGMTTGEGLTAAGASPAGNWTLSAADANGGRTMSRVEGATGPGGVFTSAMAMTNLGTPKQ